MVKRLLIERLEEGVEREMRQSVTRFKDRMFRLDEDEPLSPISILILILLDIFLLIIIFQGLSAQSGLLTSPDEYVPYVCQEIVIEKSWTEGNRIDKLGYIVLQHHRSTYVQEARVKPVHPACEEVLAAIDAVKTDDVVVQLFEERSRLMILRNDIAFDFRKMDSTTEITTSEEYLDLTNQILEIEQKINANEKVAHLWSVIDTAITKQSIVIQALRNYRAIFPIYEVLFQLLFLLPLFIAFYGWYVRSARIRFQGFISTHLLGVVSIPVFWEMVRLILYIIPHQIIKRFIEFLESLKLIAVWYYLVIALVIAMSSFLIYVVQKHIFSRERVMERRIQNRNCVECGKKLPDRDKYCTMCGAGQFEVCPNCNGETYVGGKYCQECGKKTAP